ncbi:extracellular solute-binding protein [Paenibacillus glycanilyticus]|uniref:ABC transporter substrate-binding protein n=1 Tax=Paenibacillus glycanilyticus TaxID=126569 RepID=A0ABQ6G7W3_9BACL|nr:extracellular solute-binding protein [Paenibacillus glycanilyticus]GLX67044.1 ABC transporter substrate-binding protein [Paenibacillus glycanilyticus]
MKTQTKKAIMIGMLALIVSSSLAACGSNNNNGAGNTANSQSSNNANNTKGTGNNAAATSDTASEGTNAAASTPDISKHVKLTWAALGDPPKDFDAVKAKLNEMTNKDLNADVDFVWIGWGDLDSKYPLMLMSGQNVDMIYTAGWLGYSDNAKKGAFTELTKDMLDKYAPNAEQKLPPEAWSNATVDGKIIAVPRNYLEYQDAGLAARGDIMGKAGLTALTSLDDVEKYMEAAKATDPKIVPFNTGASVGDYPLTSFVLKEKSLISVPGLPANMLLFDPLETKPQVSSAFDNPDLLAAYPKIREMFQKGYINKNVLNNKTPSRDSFQAGQSALAAYGDNQFRDSFNGINTAHPDWNVSFQSFSPEGPFIKLAYDSGMMAIPSSSGNKERALMFMDKFFSDPNYYMLMIYGIEGKHWEYTADKSQIEVPAGTDPSLYPKWQYPWGFGDWVGFNKPSTTDYPDYAKHVEHMASVAKDNPYANFKPNTDSIKNEIAALNNVFLKYGGALAYGAADPDEALKKASAELKAAGYDKVKAEIQKQLDEFTPGS